MSISARVHCTVAEFCFNQLSVHVKGLAENKLKEENNSEEHPVSYYFSTASAYNMQSKLYSVIHLHFSTCSPVLHVDV